MSGADRFGVGQVSSEAAERLATAAGAIAIVALTVVGILRAAAGQDIVRGLLERFRAELQNPEVQEEFQEEFLASVEASIDAYIAELPLALGLSPWIAALLWIVGYVLGLAVIVIAIDAFGHGRDMVEDVGSIGLGWKTVNLFLGSLAAGILIAVGLVLLIIPGLIFAVLLVFFPAAIVLDDESFFEAFGSSVGVVRANVLSTIGLIVVAIVVVIVVTVVGMILGGLLPAIGAVIVDELLAAIGTIFAMALIARGYSNATSAGL